mmetsp:Transcript_5743/g.19001  ORF Transcript_5743/g.19001 Transcript_5743/m.19001 type:complete len:235 (+) Transcript_5743:129-833(+)
MSAETAVARRRLAAAWRHASGAGARDVALAEETHNHKHTFSPTHSRAVGCHCLSQSCTTTQTISSAHSHGAFFCPFSSHEVRCWCGPMASSKSTMYGSEAAFLSPSRSSARPSALTPVLSRSRVERGLLVGSSAANALAPRSPIALPRSSSVRSPSCLPFSATAMASAPAPLMPHSHMSSASSTWFAASAVASAAAPSSPAFVRVSHRWRSPRALARPAAMPFAPSAPSGFSLR